MEGLNRYAATLFPGENVAESFGKALAEYLGGHINNSAVTGILGEYNQVFAAADIASARLEAATKSAVEFNAAYADAIKLRLGRATTPERRMAGFSGDSIALPENPLTLLTPAVAYLQGDPDRELVAQGVTAARADAIRLELLAARAASGTAKTDVTKAAKARRAGLAALRRQLVAVRSKLSTVLGSSDERWYEFGYRRPVDGRIPGGIPGAILLQIVMPDSILVRWEPAVRARNYRVQLLDSANEVVQEKLSTEVFTVLDGLDLVPGKQYTVRVNAMNKSGQGKHSETSFTIPPTQVSTAA